MVLLATVVLVSELLHTLHGHEHTHINDDAAFVLRVDDDDIVFIIVFILLLILLLLLLLLQRCFDVDVDADAALVILVVSVVSATVSTPPLIAVPGSGFDAPPGGLGCDAATATAAATASVAVLVLVLFNDAALVFAQLIAAFVLSIVCVVDPTMQQSRTICK